MWEYVCFWHLFVNLVCVLCGDEFCCPAFCMIVACELRSLFGVDLRDDEVVWWLNCEIVVVLLLVLLLLYDKLLFCCSVGEFGCDDIPLIELKKYSRKSLI